MPTFLRPSKLQGTALCRHISIPLDPRTQRRSGLPRLPTRAMATHNIARAATDSSQHRLDSRPTTTQSATSTSPPLRTLQPPTHSESKTLSPFRHSNNREHGRCTLRRGNSQRHNTSPGTFEPHLRHLSETTISIQLFPHFRSSSALPSSLSRSHHIQRTLPIGIHDCIRTRSRLLLEIPRVATIMEDCSRLTAISSKTWSYA